MCQIISARLLVMALVAGTLLQGCGLAETAGTGAGIAATEVQHAKDAKATLEKVQRDIAAAQQIEAQQRERALEQAEQ